MKNYPETMIGYVGFCLFNYSSNCYSHIYQQLDSEIEEAFFEEKEQDSLFFAIFAYIMIEDSDLKKRYMQIKQEKNLKSITGGGVIYEVNQKIRNNY